MQWRFLRRREKDIFFILKTSGFPSLHRYIHTNLTICFEKLTPKVNFALYIKLLKPLRESGEEANVFTSYLSFFVTIERGKGG